ncbi:MAG: amidohydrolase family protein [Chloroflexota bacterium]|jgi:imidazolonepropionase-like amidohydrolase|nr:amidohydrolase family protein [Chloroflexota bacterium]MEC8750094.1 amidohydrolase family protein [Chloroflexota bacterium]MEE2620992.1 amidohydrolase family protein [Chloroflexota bacterium]|tara:strand:- start:564 stop:1796 length:1233 start_codon:yes stop_codon:yes gene_type:complete
MTKNKIIKSSNISNKDLNGWVNNHAIIIENGKISNVINQEGIPELSSYEIIDFGESYAIPGIIETHAHLQFSATHDAYEIYFNEDEDQRYERAIKNAEKSLLSGVTSIRDLGSPNNLIFPLKKDIDEGIKRGPNIFPTGTPITIKDGHCWFFGSIAHNSSEIFKVIDNQLNLGATHIKIMASGGNFTPSSNPRISQYSYETIQETVNYCNSNGTYLCAHTLSRNSTIQCIESGVQNIIHGRWFDESTDKAYSFDKDYSKMIVDKGIYVDSTISKHLLEYESELKGEKQRPSNPNVNSEPSYESVINIFRYLDLEGVKIIGALDMGMSKADFNKAVASAWAHVEWLGFDHWKAIRSITITNAEAMRIEKSKGLISEGYDADMVFFKNDPSKNIRNLVFDPQHVIKGGEVIF